MPLLTRNPSQNGAAMAQPDIEVVNVTPALAEEWLAKNTHNRRLRETRVNRYATDMANGDWRWNGESIKFSKAETILDGQHRLHAVIRADVTIPMAVVRGLDDEAQETVDGGIPRAFHDVLALRGEVDAPALAAIVRKVASWEEGSRKRLDGSQFSTAELLRCLDVHPELRSFTREARRCATGCNLPGSVLGLAWWVFDQVDDEDATFFFERLADGQGLVKGDPIYELRRTLSDRQGIRQERRQMFMLAFTIKAWNAYREGRTDVGFYRFKPGGANPEKFPEPV